MSTHIPMKMVTFSYDDGVTQDQRLVDLFNQYDLKCTFNLNSALGGQGGPADNKGITFSHIHYKMSELTRIYRGHEIAVHTLTHPFLSQLSDEAVIREVEEDRLALSEAFGEEVVGMAYPFGDVDERVKRLIAEHTGVRYARTTIETRNFEPQTDLLTFNPTLHHTEWDILFKLGQEFIELQTDTPKLFYIWGHSYEFDIDNTWKKFEDFLKLISGRDDIRYCTNVEALLG